MSFRGQLIKLGFNTDGISNALWQSAARYAVGCNVASGTAFKIGGDSRTIGIDINADCATGLKFSGGYTTTAIQIGDGTTALTLAAADDHAIDIYTTCAAVTGTVQVVDIEHTHTGATYVTKIEALKVGVASSVMTGDWVNAVYAVITYTAPGTAGGGMAASVCAELTLPSQALGGGVYTLFHGYLSLGASTVLEGGTTHVVSFLRLEAGGTVGSFNDYGFLFHVVGLTAASADLLGANSYTLKVLVDSAGTPATRYLMLAQSEAGLAVTDAALILGNYGRISTSTAAGAALDVDGSAGQNEGLYLRYNITSWSGIGSSFYGAYIRAQTGASATGKELNGIEVYATAGHACGQLRAIQSYAYVKTGSTSVTIGPIYAISAELTFDLGSGTKTITTEAMPLRVKITGGKVDTYTKIHGIQIKSGDMNGTSQTYGHAIHILDDAGMTGTITWTTGLYIPQGCTTGISITGVCTTGISIAYTMAAHSDNMISLVAASTVTGGNVQPISMVHTMTGSGQVGGRALFQVNAQADLGGWICAVKGYLNFNASGSVSGVGSAVLAELNMPGALLTEGTYACVECELTCPGSMVGIANYATSFIYMRASGSTSAAFEEGGFLFDVWGVGSAASGWLYDDTMNDGKVEETLRIRVNGVAKYLLLCSTAS